MPDAPTKRIGLFEALPNVCNNQEDLTVSAVGISRDENDERAANGIFSALDYQEKNVSLERS